MIKIITTLNLDYFPKIFLSKSEKILFNYIKKVTKSNQLLPKTLYLRFFIFLKKN